MAFPREQLGQSELSAAGVPLPARTEEGMRQAQAHRAECEPQAW